jgi:hypothetical protein
LIRQEVFYTLKQTNAAWTDPDGAFGAWGWVSGYLAPFLRRTTRSVSLGSAFEQRAFFHLAYYEILHRREVSQDKVCG